VFDIDSKVAELPEIQEDILIKDIYFFCKLNISKPPKSQLTRKVLETLPRYLVQKEGKILTNSHIFSGLLRDRDKLSL
jgi:hypothetical protein